MTWVLIGMMIILGFAEYWCAHYFTRRIFGLSENRTHLILAALILIFVSLPRGLIVTAFFITSLFTPVIIWFGFKLIRNR